MPNIRKHVDEEKLMPQINKYADRCITIHVLTLLYMTNTT